MRWFGPSWGAHVNRTCEEAPRPDGPCTECGVRFADGDRGILLPFMGNPGDPPELGYHLKCLMKCFTGRTEIPDPPE